MFIEKLKSGKPINFTLLRIMAYSAVIVFVFFGQSFGGNCGDCNDDGKVNIGDAICLINYIFKSGPAPSVNNRADINCDGRINLGDAICLIRRIFQEGSAPCAYCPPLAQKYYFEALRINYAWGFWFDGIYIDSDGNMFSYEYNPEEYVDFDDWNTPLTPAELELRYSHNPEFVGLVDSDALDAKVSIISDANLGPLSLPIMRCFDAGMVLVLAYTYNKTENLYYPVLIEMAGDWAQVNTSSAASELLVWLLDVTGESLFCRY